VKEAHDPARVKEDRVKEAHDQAARERLARPR